VTGTTIGHDFELRAPFQGKNRSRRKLHASKEKGCQEKETLTVRETILRTNQEIQKSLSREAPLQGFFIDPRTLKIPAEVHPSKNEGLSRTPARARNADRK
jgi:hypothetical protein